MILTFRNLQGVNTKVRSWVPSLVDGAEGDIIGMVIRHGEAFSMSDYFTVYSSNNEPIYRPTVHYAYVPSDETVNSLEEVNIEFLHVSKTRQK